ncbi:MAG: alkaline phosphatase family protein, partial [Prevotella sp.]|nr:alkaline phosphatase family protein [Prevotella sp.]
MKKTLTAFIMLLSVLSASADNFRPKLIVGIVVDQMRWDYLYRFYNEYGTGGFRRMLADGYTFEDC